MAKSLSIAVAFTTMLMLHCGTDEAARSAARPLSKADPSMQNSKHESLMPSVPRAGADLSANQALQRFGVGSIDLAFASLPPEEILKFKTGWFHNWRLARSAYPSSAGKIPSSMTNVELVGGYGATAMTEAVCKAGLQARIKAEYPNGGQVRVGNEIGWDDSRDPLTFAKQYKGWYDCVKSAHPGIKVAPGANPGSVVFQYRDAMKYWAIPEDPQGRWSVTTGKSINYIQYMTIVRNEYRRLYGVEMPVDFYVIHLYGLGPNWEGKWTDVAFLRSTLVEFRKFMKGIGHERKELIVKEAGFLDPAVPAAGHNTAAMSSILDMLHKPDVAHAIDRTYGNPNDNLRLVQRFSWFNAVSPLESGAAGYEWRNTSFFQCRTIGPNYAMGCSSRSERPLAVGYKSYLDKARLTADTASPAAPTLSYQKTAAGTVVVYFAAADNLGSTNYSIGIGTDGKWQSVQQWADLGPATSQVFAMAAVDKKHVFVKARDDGFNESAAGGIEIDVSSPAGYKVHGIMAGSSSACVKRSTALSAVVGNGPGRTVKGYQIFVARKYGASFGSCLTPLLKMTYKGRTVHWCQLSENKAAWTPIETGSYVANVNVDDSSGRRCSGNPFYSPPEVADLNFVDCDVGASPANNTGDRDHLEILVTSC